MRSRPKRPTRPKASERKRSAKAAPATSAKVVRTTCEFTGAEDIADASGRVDRVVQQLTGLSRAGVRGLFDHGCVSVNGQACTDSAARAQNGDQVEVRYNPNQRYKEKPSKWSDPAFELIHEDEFLLVVNKSAHVLTVPTGKKSIGTLVHVLQKYLDSQPRGRRDVPRRPFIVHRLDRGVSGLLVFGKSQAIASKLKDQFAAHKPQRTYIAIVAGEMEQARGTFRSHLATDATLNRYSTDDEEHGELAVTHYRVLNTVRGATIVQVNLETGRRNQIRVHFAEAGHPVLGDPRYPRDHPGSAKHPRWRARRLALHAVSLALKHPATGKPMQFESPLPQEFASFGVEISHAMPT
jgi:23S rRNA pseudouridine1911/1915/1917 synthase